MTSEPFRIPVEIPEGSVALYAVGVVYVQAANGDTLVCHAAGNVTSEGNDEEMPVLTAVGMLEMVKDSILHPAPEASHE